MDKIDFNKLKEVTVDKFKFNNDNIQSKISTLAIFYDEYLRIFIKENKELSEIEIAKQTRYAELYKHFKYHSDVRWENRNEIETQMYTDQKYVDLIKKYNDQEEITKYLDLTLANIKNQSFAFKNYIEWQMFLSGK